MSKNVHVYVRLPPRIVARIKATVATENERRVRRGLEPVLLFGPESSVSLPQWLERAARRETARAWRETIPEPTLRTVEEYLGGPTLGLNFAISDRLASRCAAAIVLVNKRRWARNLGPICLRGGLPSLPQWVLRAGLRELRRQERRIARAAMKGAA